MTKTHGMPERLVVGPNDQQAAEASVGVGRVASALIAGGADVGPVRIALRHAPAVVTPWICAYPGLGRAKKTAPGPSWTPCSAACGPGADRETLQPK